MSETDIRQAMNLLLEEGRVYSTINENTFKIKIMRGGMDNVNTNKDRFFEVMDRHNYDNEEGTSIQECITELPGMSESYIQQAMNLLLVKGQVYSTINENIFKIAQ